jgi:hypothetical protein
LLFLRQYYFHLFDLNIFYWLFYTFITYYFHNISTKVAKGLNHEVLQHQQMVRSSLIYGIIS